MMTSDKETLWGMDWAEGESFSVLVEHTEAGPRMSRLTPTRSGKEIIDDYHKAVGTQRPKLQEQKKMSKPNHLISLLQKDFTTVEVIFPSSNGQTNKNAQTYTYKVPSKLVTEGLKELDMLVIPARGGFAVVCVAKIHETPQIDLDADFEYQWIVQKVDTSGYDAQILKEREFRESMKAIEKEKKKAEALADFKKYLPVEALPLLEGAVEKLNQAN